MLHLDRLSHLLRLYFRRCLHFRRHPIHLPSLAAAEWRNCSSLVSEKRLPRTWYKGFYERLTPLPNRIKYLHSSMWRGWSPLAHTGDAQFSSPVPASPLGISSNRRYPV